MIEEVIARVVAETLKVEIAKLNAERDQDEILTAEEAMQVLKCTYDVLKKYRSEGMPYIMGSPHRYVRGQITKWIKDNYVISRK